MNINIKKIFQNTIFFYKKQFSKILLISIISALITIPIDRIIITNKQYSSHLLNYKTHQNNLIKSISKITKKEKKIFIKTYIYLTCSSLIENTLLYVILINTIDTILKGGKNNIYKLVYKIINNFPKSFISTIITNTMIEIGTIIFIFPGIIIASILSLSQIILIIEKKKIIHSIKKSILITYDNIRIIIFNISLIFLIKIIIFIISTNIIILPTITNFAIVHIINNLISSMQIIYTFRYYILKNKNNIEY